MAKTTQNASKRHVTLRTRKLATGHDVSGDEQPDPAAAQSVRLLGAHIVESLSSRVLVLRCDLGIRMANKAFLQAYRMQRAEFEHQIVNGCVATSGTARDFSRL